MKFNPLRKLVTGLAILTAGSAAGKAPATISENPNNVTPIETPEIKTDPMNNAEVVSFAAEQEREMKIKKLEQKKHKLEEALQKKTDELHQAQSWYSNSYQKAFEYSGFKAKFKHSGLEYRLNDLATQMAEQSVGTKKITSEESVNEIMGILLSADGKAPFHEEVNQLNDMMGGQLGSTVIMNPSRPGGKLESEDMNIHAGLGTAPQQIVKSSLEIVQLNYDIAGIAAELNNLLNVPPEMTAQN